MNEDKKSQVFNCHKISEGVARGEVLISKDDICFYLIDPATGVLIEKGHDIEGKSMAGKILIFPRGKGSSVVQADGLYQLAIKNNSPRAIIIESPDTVTVASAIIMEVPMVDKVEAGFYELIKDGDTIEVDATNGKIRIVKN